MALDSAQTVIAGTGAVYAAPVGTTAPTDVTTAFGAGWIECGFTSEDGVVLTMGKSVDEKMAWQSEYAVRRTITSRSASVAFTLLQWNTNNWKVALAGATVTIATGISKLVPPSGSAVNELALAVQFADGADTYRLIIPKGMSTDDFETNLTRTDLATLPVTFAATATGVGDPIYLLTNNVTDFVVT